MPTFPYSGWRRGERCAGGLDAASEARLFLFTGHAHGEAEPPVKRVAASDLKEAMVYMRKWHADLDIVRVELVAAIEMLSGSPLN